MNNELVVFIRNQIREFNLPINENTRIEDDLGVTGEEAEDLISAFSSRFGVDISSFKFENFFYAEPSVFINEDRKSLLTVGHLQKAIEVGYLA